MLNTPFGPPAADAAAPDEATIKLAAYFHLEWCADCADWRPQGHSADEKQQRAGAIAQRQEEETSSF